MEIKPLRSNLEKILEKQNLMKKWQKAQQLFQKNIRHPSLYVELLKPRWRGYILFGSIENIEHCFFSRQKGESISNHKTL